MTLNRSGIRTDIAYLSRRIKPGATAGPGAPGVRAPSAPAEPGAPAPSPSAPSASAPSSSAPRMAAAPSLSLSPPAAAPAPAAPPAAMPSLSLSPTAAAPAPAAAPAAAPSLSLSAAPTPAAVASAAPPSRLFDAPGIAGIRQLDAQTPMIRLDRRQSAVGSLLVSGTSAVAWESIDRVSGTMTVDGAVSGTVVECRGNRPLVGYVDGTAVVTLRHVRELRRALFIGLRSGPMTVEIFDGAAVALPASADPRFILSLTVIDGMIELRAEPVPPRADDAFLWQEFGFSPTTHTAARRHGP